VIGAGGIGAFLIYAAAELGGHVTVADLSPERLRIAGALGAGTLIDPAAATDLPAALAELGIEPQVIFEVTGTEAGLRSALGAAAPGGARLVLTGLHEQPRAIDLRQVTLREIELIGTNAHVCGVDLPEAIRLLATRKQGWSDLAPEAFPLRELVDEGLAPLAERRAARIKTLIDPWADTRRPADTVPR
jgi:threonine dehydrogenase-like Zn-dependent dehydrogenase